MKSRAASSFTAFLFLLTSGCSGGSSVAPPTLSTGITNSSTLSITGTVAAGAPVAGYVEVYDSSSNPQPVIRNVPIDPNGRYTLDTGGLVPPLAFHAVGSVGGISVSLYSAATSEDIARTINITPFTNLIVMNIAADAVQNYIRSGALSGLTADELTAQNNALVTALAPALLADGLSNTIDLLRQPFFADNSGLDGFMDVVRVDATNPATVTITNILDAANQLTIDTTAGNMNPSYSGTLGLTGLASSAAVLRGILETITALEKTLANKLPSATNPNVLALVNSNFLNDGKNHAAYLAFLADPANNNLGLTISNLVLDSYDVTTGIADVTFNAVAQGGLVQGTMPFKFILNEGVWQLYGDQRIAKVSVNAFAQKASCYPDDPNCVPATTFRSGLKFSIKNDGTPAHVGSAVVTGPGLPSGGVTLALSCVTCTDLAITTLNASPNDLCASCWNMVDADIANVSPNSSYSVQLYDTGTPPVLLATYAEVVGAAPVLSTALPSSRFPVIGNGMVNLAGLISANLTLPWTIPVRLTCAACGVSAAEISVSVVGGTHSKEVDIPLADNPDSSGQAVTAIPAPSSGTWLGGYYKISVLDLYGGSWESFYQ